MLNQLQFPEPPDLEVDHIGDNKPVTFQRFTLANPHPGFGKNPNILNEYGHTKYPMWIKNAAKEDVIVNNAKEEAIVRSTLPVEDGEKDALKAEVAKLKAAHAAIVVPVVDHEKEALKAELAALKESLSIKKQTAAAALKTDGPTVQQWIAAGYKAKDYPPPGYTAKSPDEEVNALIEAEEEAEDASVKSGWGSGLDAGLK